MEINTIGIAQVIAPSFPKAVKRVRASLARHGLSIASEHDNASRFHTLYVVCPFLLLETLAFDQSAAVFVPAHVVLSPVPAGAEVRWLTAAAFDTAGLTAGVARPVHALHAKVDSAIRSLQSRERPFLLRGRDLRSIGK